MAKGKSAKKAPRRKSSRRVSGLANGMLAKVGGALVGYVGARMISEKVLPNLDGKIKGAAVAAAGIFLVPKVLKNQLGEGLAIGFGVAGGHMVLQSTGLLAGVSNYLPSYTRPMLAGSGIPQSVAGTEGISQTVGGGSSRTYARRRAEA